MVSAAPHYAILDGRLHRQDVPGGRWTMLDDAEQAALLARLAAPAPCPSCRGSGIAFDCGHWPRCGRPGGTIAPGCPGKTVPCPACTPQAGDAFNHPL